MLRPLSSSFAASFASNFVNRRVRSPRATLLHPASVLATPARRSYSMDEGAVEKRGSASTGAEGLPRKQSDPLRILFCGSDEFSAFSLRALHREQETNPRLIESIDVVVRPGKRTGRGLKTIRYPPLRKHGSELGLAMHERDTFAGWKMPAYINLIVAVSFGLFVPPRLLQAAKYGGLNIHPSLLPDFRGPAPLHHTLLHRANTTGVTLQTLDEKAFDRGLILRQTSVTGIQDGRLSRRPYRPDNSARFLRDTADLTASDAFSEPDVLGVPGRIESVHDLHVVLAPLGAELLIDGLRDGLHVPPVRPSEPEAEAEDEAEDGPPRTSRPRYAPKIRTEDRQLIPLPPDPNEAHIGLTDLSGFRLRRKVIGPLWFGVKDRSGAIRRIIIGRATAHRMRASLPLKPDGLLRQHRLLGRLTTYGQHAGMTYPHSWHMYEDARVRRGGVWLIEDEVFNAHDLTRTDAQELAGPLPHHQGNTDDFWLIGLFDLKLEGKTTMPAREVLPAFATIQEPAKVLL